MSREVGINNRARHAFEYVVFWVGVLLTVGGLCILLLGLLRR